MWARPELLEYDQSLKRGRDMAFLGAVLVMGRCWGYPISGLVSCWGKTCLVASWKFCTAGAEGGFVGAAWGLSVQVVDPWLGWMFFGSLGSAIKLGLIGGSGRRHALGELVIIEK